MLMLMLIADADVDVDVDVDVNVDVDVDADVDANADAADVYFYVARRESSSTPSFIAEVILGVSAPESHSPSVSPPARIDVPRAQRPPKSRATGIRDCATRTQDSPAH